MFVCINNKKSLRLLLEYILTHLLLFNRRQQGEISKIKIQTYTANAEIVSRYPEVEEYLWTLVLKWPKSHFFNFLL